VNRATSFAGSHRRIRARRAVLRLAVLSCLSLLSPSAKAKDRVMRTLTPLPFFETRTLVDLAAVASSAGVWLVTVEHAGQWTRPSPNLPPMEPAEVRIWSMASGTHPAAEVAHGPGPMPYGIALDMALLRGQLITFMEVNETAPAWLLSAPWANPPVVGPFATPAELMPDPALVESIRINPMHSWSTLGLNPEEWMFRPSLTADIAAERLILAMNTADGKAVVWAWSLAAPGAHPVREAVVPAALDPVPVPAGGRRFLLFRRMPADWSIFFRSRRYAAGRRPEALPLMLVELDASGTVRHSTDLSASLGIGNVFEFAARANGADIVIAAATGTVAEPRLSLLTVNHAGEALPDRAEAMLRGVPLRVAMSGVGATTLVGLVYQVADRFIAEAIWHAGH
jgi:hypothetical protein